LAGTLPQIAWERNEVFYGYWSPVITVSVESSGSTGVADHPKFGQAGQYKGAYRHLSLPLKGF
jgi:hypothetical protein